MRKLREMCLDFVATHVWLVDSFEGFPSSIAEELWTACFNLLDLSVLSGELLKVIELFVESYPSEFLPEAKLNFLDVINDFEDPLVIALRNVVKLDLSGCQLGDSHHLLRAVGLECKKLEFLNLTNNRLSNRGLRSLFGIKQSSDCRLRRLVISSNLGITFDGLRKYVFPCRTLRSITMSVPGDSKIVNEMESAQFHVVNTLDVDTVICEGWAAKLIDLWDLTSVQFERNKKAKDERARKFYFGQRKNLQRGRPDVDEELDERKLTFIYRQTDPTIRPPPAKKAKLIDVLSDEDFESIVEMYQ